MDTARERDRRLGDLFGENMWKVALELESRKGRSIGHTDPQLSAHGSSPLQDWIWSAERENP